jgi:ABC-type nitrate/sulfonate/bicarbonate transport system permease component
MSNTTSTKDQVKSVGRHAVGGFILGVVTGSVIAGTIVFSRFVTGQYKD